MNELALLAGDGVSEMTLENLLRMQIDGTSPVTGEAIKFSPDFRVAVQNLEAEVDGKRGVHVIIHAQDHNSETMDFLVCGNDLIDVRKSYQMTPAEADIALLQAALFGLIGTDSKDELRKMLDSMPLYQAPDTHKEAMINAIHALLATMNG